MSEVCEALQAQYYFSPGNVSYHHGSCIPLHVHAWALLTPAIAAVVDFVSFPSCSPPLATFQLIPLVLRTFSAAHVETNTVQYCKNP